MLRRFTDGDGRLTVVHVRPEPEVERGKHPRRVGLVPELNTWQHDDGTVDDELERVPLNRLDNAGAQALRDVVAFADDVEPSGQMRLLDRGWQERLQLTLHIAGLMVRGPLLRDRLDEVALPTLIQQMRENLFRELAEGRTTEEVARPLLLALDRPGMVTLEPGRNRHQAALLDLVQTVTAAIGSTHLVAVRRVSEPLLTGSEPVVCFENADIVGGVPCARLLTDADPPVRFWDESEPTLARVTEVLSATAGPAFAADRHTVVLMFNPDTTHGGKLAFMASELSDEALTGILNIKVAGASAWVAGAAGDKTLEVLAGAVGAAARTRGSRRPQ